MFRHVPNLLTGLRLAAAPATAGLLTTGHFDAAFGIFAVAGASDAADGFLAKRFGLTSRLGSYLDPMADKALMLAAFVALNILGAVPLWLTLVIVARELLFFAAIGAALAAGAPLIIRPLLIGKVGTALQVLYIAAHLAALAACGIGAVVVLLHPLVHDRIATIDFRGRGVIGKAGDEDEVGLTIARVDAVKDVIVENPALRLGERLV